MGGMKGCEAWKALCAAPGTAVAQCTSPGPAPNVPTTFQTKADIDVRRRRRRCCCLAAAHGRARLSPASWHQRRRHRSS